MLCCACLTVHKRPKYKKHVRLQYPYAYPHTCLVSASSLHRSCLLALFSEFRSRVARRTETRPTAYGLQQQLMMMPSTPAL